MRGCWILAVGAALAVTGSVAAATRMSDAEYLDRVRGAWTAKCIGGTLGMPLESWRHADIEAKYPNLTGFVGYDQGAQKGWSDFIAEVEIPKDGAWHPITVTVKAPGFSRKDLFAGPIIGLSLEKYTAARSYELRNVRVMPAKKAIPFDDKNWTVSNACAWTPDGTAKADFTGERSWLKMRATAAKSLDLKPGVAFTLAFDAKWHSGDNTVGVALDYYSRGGIQGFGPDDDTSYQIVGLVALEKYGPGLTAEQIGEEWVRLLPEIHPSLAEGIALQRMRSGIKPPESGIHPVGEAIGGQMKGEIWGLVCPGRPDLAAEYARRDGVVAHQKNGVYGEQFVAAMMAQSFVEKDVRRLIETGLKYIPADSEYASVVRSVMASYDAKRPWKDVVKELTTKYPGICDPVYAEAGIVTLGLLYGGGDFEKSILLTARCGNDTDCNTATVAALLGCIRGEKALPAKWKKPVGDEFRCFVKGYENWSIKELSQRIMAAGRRIADEGVGFSVLGVGAGWGPRRYPYSHTRTLSHPLRPLHPISGGPCTPKWVIADDCPLSRPWLVTTDAATTPCPSLGRRGTE